MIIRPVETLRGWEKIAKRFGCAPKTVKGWQRSGAPIYFVAGTWTTDAAELWDWIKGVDANVQKTA